MVGFFEFRLVDSIHFFRASMKSSLPLNKAFAKGGCSIERPRISAVTLTCPSQSVPAPIPIVGIVKCFFNLLEISPGICSRTIAKHPDS
tara:strand:- start:6 stop:272 length:267 start_codon:yes stop_codon:yes gene_type:complete